MRKADKPIVDSILHALDTNPHAVERAVLLVGANQTPYEAMAGVTREQNGIGFTGCDAGLGTFLINCIDENTRRGIPEGQRLRGKALDMARSMIKKYAATQLLRAAKAKAASKAA